MILPDTKQLAQMLRNRSENVTETLLLVLAQMVLVSGDHGLSEHIRASVPRDNSGSTEPEVDWAAMALLEPEDPQQRLGLFDTFVRSLFSRVQRDFVEGFWVSQDAAETLCALINGDDVHCLYRAALHPAILLAMRGHRVKFFAHVEQGIDRQDQSAVMVARALRRVLHLHHLDIENDPPADDRRSDIDLLIPPLGERVTVARISSDMSAFIDPLKTSGVAFDVLATARSLTGQARRSILCVSEGMLTRAVGPEIQLRQTLFQRWSLGLEPKRGLTVVSITGSPFYYSSALRRCLMVLDKPARSDIVRMVAVEPHRQRGRAWPFLTKKDWNRLLCDAVEVSLPRIIDNQCNLTSGRYRREESKDGLAGLLDHARRATQICRLDSLVRVERAGAYAHDDTGSVTLHEVTTPDILESGFVTVPARSYAVGDRVAFTAQRNKLRAGDMVMAVRGYVGRCGIIPPKADDPDQIWVASLSMIILRRQTPEIIPVEALHLYLTTPAVQEHLNDLAGGSAQPALHPDGLRALEIPMPDGSQLQSTMEAFAMIQQRYARIAELKRKADEDRAGAWPQAGIAGHVSG